MVAEMHKGGLRLAMLDDLQHAFLREAARALAAVTV
jgi:hypothetical protein